MACQHILLISNRKISTQVGGTLKLTRFERMLWGTCFHRIFEDMPINLAIKQAAGLKVKCLICLCVLDFANFGSDGNGVSSFQSKSTVL